MKNFEDIKSQWENQPEINIPYNGPKLIIEKMTFIKRKQRITNMVLGVTVTVLVGFFLYIAAYSNLIAALALLLMIGSLLSRILIEFFSIKKLKRINMSADAKVFKQKIIDYYKNRIKTHYIITPIIIVLYAIGFIILLPFLKGALSSGFYTYIKVSAVVILVVLGIFIRKQILKELVVLKELCH